MADEALQLLAVGKKHILLEEFYEALNVLQDACERLGKIYGQSADECAEAYFLYGKALLEVARLESNELNAKDMTNGAAVSDESESDDDDDEEDEERDEGEVGDEKEERSAVAEVEAGVAKADAGNVEKAAVEKKKDYSDEAAVEEAGAASAAADDAPPKRQSESDKENDEVTPADAEQNQDDLQLAWEMLDLSRLIYERRVLAGNSNDRAKLADVYYALGEVGLESEQFAQALGDLQSCLHLQEEYVDDHKVSREISGTVYQIGSVYDLMGDFANAERMFRRSIEILQTRLGSLPKDANSEATAECADLESMIKEITLRLADLTDEKRESTIARQIVQEQFDHTSVDAHSDDNPLKAVGGPPKLTDLTSPAKGSVNLVQPRHKCKAAVAESSALANGGLTNGASLNGASHKGTAENESPSDGAAALNGRCKDAADDRKRSFAAARDEPDSPPGADGVPAKRVKSHAEV